MSKVYELEQKHIVNGMFKLADDIILKKQKELANKSSSDSTASGPQSFIDQLFSRLSDDFDLDDIRDELNTFIVAVSCLPLLHISVSKSLIVVGL